MYFIRRHNVSNDIDLISDSGTNNLDDDETLNRSAKRTYYSTKWGPKGYNKTNHCLHLLVLCLYCNINCI